MAIFTTTLARLMREKIFTDISTSPSGQVQTSVTTKVVSFHSGDQPTANQAISNWDSYSSTSSSFLSLTGFNFSETSTSSYTLSSIGSPTAIRSGTATFAIIYDAYSISSSTLATVAGIQSSVGIMIVPVSDVNTTTGVFKLLNTNLVIGSAFTVTDFTLTFNNI